MFREFFWINCLKELDVHTTVDCINLLLCTLEIGPQRTHHDTLLDSPMDNNPETRFQYSISTRMSQNYCKQNKSKEQTELIDVKPGSIMFLFV